MSDDHNITEEPIDNSQQPTEESSQSLREESTGQISNPKSEIENMETHHPHHLTHKKKWTEYLLEFIMLFLAVFLGFVAENIREHSVEHHKEKQHMQSLLSDLHNDINELNNKEKELNAFPPSLNQLADYCNRTILTDSIQQAMYDLNMRYLGTMQIYFTEKTASQLKNSDGMRLIRNPEVSDSITNYWQGIEDLKFTYQNYENYRRPLRQLSFKIFNYTVYKDYDKTKVEFTGGSPKLMIMESLLLKEYGNQVSMISSNIVHFYLPAIRKQKGMATNLIGLIKKEYDLQ